MGRFVARPISDRTLLRIEDSLSEVRLALPVVIEKANFLG